MVTIRKMKPTDWNEVKMIYKEGIRKGIATFETNIPESFEAFNQRVCPDSALVAVIDEVVLGWCKLSPVSDRKVYEGVAEISIYVHQNARGKGVGTALLKELVKQSEQLGYWTLQASIFPENIVSIQLHKKAGFREVGIRERIGKLNNEWRDNLLMERRSEFVGK